MPDSILGAGRSSLVSDWQGFCEFRAGDSGLRLESCSAAVCSVGSTSVAMSDPDRES